MQNYCVDNNVTRVFVKIPESTMTVIVLIACICMASVALEGEALSLLQDGWEGGGGRVGARAPGAPLLPLPMQCHNTHT